MNNKEKLVGGRNDIYKVDQKVIRPVNIWSKTVHDFLGYLNKKGIDFVPIPYEINDKYEIVSFIEGEVYNYPLPLMFHDDLMIVSAAVLLKKYHNVSEQYLSQLNGKEEWMLPTLTPIEVICHGDFAPYNIVINNNQANAIIDFDTIHPGSKMWDISYAIYRFVPLINPQSKESFGTFEEKIRRVKLFLDTYNVSKSMRDEFVDTLIFRLESLVKYIENEAKNGNDDFQGNIDNGHLVQYLDDIKYLKVNKEKIQECLNC